MTARPTQQRPYVSNPVSCWVTPSTEKSYWFKPGFTPYAVRMPEKGCVRFNVMIWANSVDHVYEILKGMCEHHTACVKEYADGGHGISYNVSPKWELINEAVEDFGMEIHQINLNQVFKLAWAGNDTL